MNNDQNVIPVLSVGKYISLFKEKLVIAINYGKDQNGCITLSKILCDKLGTRYVRIGLDGEQIVLAADNSGSKLLAVRHSQHGTRLITNRKLLRWLGSAVQPGVYLMEQAEDMFVSSEYLGTIEKSQENTQKKVHWYLSVGMFHYNGRILLNPRLNKALGTHYVKIGYDSERNCLGLIPSDDKDSDVFNIKGKTSGSIVDMAFCDILEKGFKGKYKVVYNENLKRFETAEKII